MPNDVPWDGFFYPTLTPMIESYILIMFTDTYSVFVSSDPDTYLLSIHCASTQPLRRCPVEDAFVNFMVKELVLLLHVPQV